MDTNKFDFLTSTRFWAVVIGMVAVYLQAKGIFGTAEMTLVAGITGLFTTIRTIDRNTGDARLAATKAVVNHTDGKQGVN